MKKIGELALKPGETVFVDSVHDGVARLVIGGEGERVETVDAEGLPEDARKAGTHLKVDADGALKRDDEQGRSTAAEVNSLMDDIFGSEGS